MKENSIRRAVREGRAALGTGLKEFATRGVPWIIESSGFDYCMIDMEHGAFDLETIANLAGWFAATNVSPVVRMSSSKISVESPRLIPRWSPSSRIPITTAFSMRQPITFSVP